MAAKTIALHGRALRRTAGGATPAKLTHAVAGALRGDTGRSAAASWALDLGQIPFQFNPKELSISKSAKWAR